jgi:urease accessory protein
MTGTPIKAIRTRLGQPAAAGTITIMAVTTTTSTAMAEAGFLPLLCWLSPSFPIGAYAYSHGLEWAVEAGDIRDEASLQAWLADILHHGLGRNDAVLLSAAHRAGCALDRTSLSEANELALALAGSAEFRLETAQQGRSFLDAIRAAWPHPSVEALAADLDEIALPVALGLSAACHGLDIAATAKAYLTALTQNLVSAAIRLAPIGQTSGQRVLARMMPDLANLAEEALGLGLHDVGSATFRADLGSFRHETQYTRLFRS